MEEGDKILKEKENFKINVRDQKKQEHKWKMPLQVYQ